jgi:pimeloyl-ACP methyl ester carboxylesterase
MTASPTVVLVHGAFTDASSWWAVVLRLLGSGHRVLAPPLTLRSLSHDSDDIEAFVERVDGPVLLVGHGYGAAVATVAGRARNVVGLMFVSGYALERGESIGDLRDSFPPVEASRHFAGAQYRDGSGGYGTEITVEIERFPSLVADGVPSDEASVLAVSQRPIAVSVLEERAGAEAWRTKPSWGVVSTNDLTVSPDLQRFVYRRARCREVIALPGPYLVTQTHAPDIVRFIQAAAAELTTHD